MGIAPSIDAVVSYDDGSLSNVPAGHTHSFPDLVDKPTTLEGYGITDAAAAVHSHDANDITGLDVEVEAQVTAVLAGKFIDTPTAVSLSSYADLQALFDVLAPKNISAPLTINIGDSTVTHANVVKFDHADAHNIKFVGTTVDVIVASIASITSNAAYSHDVILNLADATNAAIGNFLYIAAGAISDASSSWLEGSWRISAKAGNTVTVRVTDARAALTGTVSNIPARVQKSILRWNSNVSGGLVLWGVAAGRFEDIVFDGQYDIVVGPVDNGCDGITSATTVHATTGLPDDSMIGGSVATFRRCSFVRWRGNGVYTSGAASLDLTTSHSCSNGWRGLQAAGGPASLFAKSAVASGNRKSGASFETGGVLTLNNSTVAGNGEQGLYGTGGGNGIGTSLKIIGNQTGVEVKDAGFWNIDSSVLRSNGAYHTKAIGSAAAICVDGVNTSGAIVAAFFMQFGGHIHARSSAPMCAEATIWATDGDFRGYATTISNYGTITHSVSYSSTAAPYGGYRISPDNNGGLVIGTRPTAVGATTNRARFTASAFQPEVDLGYNLGSPGNQWSTAYIASMTGNAATASKLITARTINGVGFDGSANITINAVDSTARIAATEKGAASGVATLDGGGKIPSSQLPALAITSTYVVASQAAHLALTTEEGDVVVRTDQHKSYIRLPSTLGTMADYQELETPTDSVLSVNGATGAVTITTITGNAGTATALATGRNFSISGGGITAATVGFNGTAAVVLNASVDAGHITFTRMANLAPNSIIGNNTGISATPLALTGGQVTAMLSTVVANGAQGVMSGADKAKLDGIANNANVGTVTSVSVATANGISGSVATATSTPAITLTLGAITPTSVAASGAITSTVSIGYATGAGGFVTQLTSKGTGTTLNKVCGQITMSGAALAANTAAAFTLTNSTIGAEDEISVWIKSGVATGGSYIVGVDAVFAGSCRIFIRNLTAGSLSEAVIIGFAVRKGVVS